MLGAQRFLTLVLGIGVNFSACIGLAVTALPEVASASDTALVSLSMSPADAPAFSCESTVRSAQVHARGTYHGCTDTRGCVQQSMHGTIERSIATIDFQRVFPAVTILASHSIHEHSAASLLHRAREGPLHQQAIYSKYFIAQKE